MWSFALGTMIVNENIQNWSAHTAYGSYTQEIPAGTISMTRCLVSPGAAANGEGSIGRIQLSATTGIIEFPELSSSGEVEFTILGGSTGRSVKLQKFSNENWVDLITFNGINATGNRFFYRIAQDSPTLLRISNPSHALYIHDMFITDYSASQTPVLDTPILVNTTYSTIALKGFISSSGSSPISERGFCWGIDPLPDTTGEHLAIGNGISPINANIIDLTPNTTYFIRAYAINASGTSYSEPIEATTINIETPTIQASNLVFYPGNTTVQVSWTPGNGSRRIVKINTENIFTDPTNGTENTPNSVYSGIGEQIVYCGATQIIEGDPVNGITVSGLTRNITYWFRVYEMNGADEGAIYLNTTAIANPSSCTTLNTGLAGYYNGISGTGANLKAQLHDVLRTTHLTQYSYDALWQQLQYTDEDSLNTNNVIETYTGWSVPKNFYGGGTTQWNREHTWSVSHGGFETNRPAGTDLHHIRPCDVTVNSAKGNKDFNDGGNPYNDSSPYPGYSSTTGSGTSTYFWEPRPNEKGDVARMLFYMAVRYEGTDTGYNLEMMDTIPTAGSYYGSLSTLLQWHLNDPPDSWERRRNDRIQERQGNRNPFIDHPEFANKLWIPTAGASVIQSDSLFVAAWNHCINATNYQVDVSLDSLFTTYLYQNYDTGYDTMSQFNVGASDLVYYRVRARFGDGFSPYSNVVMVDMTLPPLDLESFTAAFIDPNNISLDWTTNYETSVIYYYLQRGSSSSLQDAETISSLISATNTSQPASYNFIDTELPLQPDGGYLYYWLRAPLLDGDLLAFGPVSIYVQPTSTDEEILSPDITGISAYPNPFADIVKLNMSNQKTASLIIYNLKGQQVREWKGLHPAKQSLIWDGRDDSGKHVASGIYLLRLNDGKQTQTIKLLKLK
jgi:endonuclease I